VTEPGIRSLVMTHLPRLHWYDNPIVLWIVELIALGVLLGTIGGDWPATADAVVGVAAIVAFGALNLTTTRRRARRT
jgi:hypothetical protein